MMRPSCALFAHEGICVPPPPAGADTGLGKVEPDEPWPRG